MDLDIRPELWVKGAVCGAETAELFFAPRSTGRSARDAHEPAKALCRACPVRPQCLDYALRMEANTISADRLHGIYGGMDDHERMRLRGLR